MYFRLKMVVRPKHVADNLNKIVNNYWNRVALDGNPWTWSTNGCLFATIPYLCCPVEVRPTAALPQLQRKFNPVCHSCTIEFPQSLTAHVIPWPSVQEAKRKQQTKAWNQLLHLELYRRRVDRAVSWRHLKASFRSAETAFYWSSTSRLGGGKLAQTFLTEMHGKRNHNGNKPTQCLMEELPDLPKHFLEIQTRQGDIVPRDSHEESLC
jgi:hypothetical protein